MDQVGREINSTTLYRRPDALKRDILICQSKLGLTVNLPQLGAAPLEIQYLSIEPGA